MAICSKYFSQMKKNRPTNARSGRQLNIARPENQVSTFLSLLVFFVLASFANDAPFAWNLLKDAKFKKAYKAALGAKVNEPWLAELPGPQ